MSKSKEPLPFVKLEGDPGDLLSKVGPAICPAWLSAKAKAEWRRVAPRLEELGLLCALDKAMLASYCQSFTNSTRLGRFLEKHGSTYKTSDGKRHRRPEVRWAAEWQALAKNACKKFGMIPSPLGRMSFPGQVEPLDRMDEILDQPKRKGSIRAVRAELRKK
jgi:P27 family predicted phage terminase small subunit